jgi:transaldolase
MPKSRAEQLLDLGQSVWLDYIRRGQLVSGEFDRLVAEQGVVGVTSNPTIFQQAIAESRDYDQAIQARITDGLQGAPLFEAIAVEDVRNACERLHATYERTGGRDGRVSIEVSPHQAHDTAGTIAEARRLRAAVGRDNVMIKVPATLEGLPAIATLTGEGMSVNITLIFSLARYQQVTEAWLSGLEARAARNEPLDTIRSVASFFVSRVDSKVDKAIDEAVAQQQDGPARAELVTMKGQAAIANARLAYARFKDMVAGPRFQALAARGAYPQRPLWASTSTKNPAYRDVLYVEELIGPDTVNTMPPQTLAAFNDHGVLEPRLERHLDRAQALFDRLPQLGIPIDALIAQLEPEGVAAFSKSFDSLLEALENKRRELVA